jgi:hypothetical protein
MKQKSIQPSKIDRQVYKQEQKLEKLKAQQKKIQATEGQRDDRQDILQWSVSSSAKEVRKNQFTTYNTQVLEIKNRFLARTDYGSSLTRTGIELPAAFIAGDGVSYNADNDKIKTFIKKLYDINKLTGSGLIDYVEEGLKEGKILFVLENTADGVLAVHKPYDIYKYVVKTDAYDRYESVSWNTTSGEVTKKKDEFVYCRFGGNSGDVNISPPRIANCLTQIDNYERALYDWRESNHLYGFPTPVFETADTGLAAWIVKLINAVAWKIGKAIAVPAKAYYLSPPSGAMESLKGEMSINLKIVSSVIGVPVHWLGWTDLMSNRSTADSLAELISFTTKKDRLKWVEILKEIVQKAMAMTPQFGVTDPDGFIIDLPVMTTEKLKEIIEVWFPLNQAGKIDDYTLLNKIPDIDQVEVMENLKKQKEEQAAEVPETVNRMNQKFNNLEQDAEEVPPVTK